MTENTASEVSSILQDMLDEYALNDGVPFRQQDLFESISNQRTLLSEEDESSFSLSLYQDLLKPRLIDVDEFSDVVVQNKELEGLNTQLIDALKFALTLNADIREELVGRFSFLEEEGLL